MKAIEDHFINKESTPAMFWASELTKKLIKYKPFSFVKFGDGELICMSGREGQNCDDHPYSPELAQKLNDAFEFFKNRDNVFIGKWEWEWSELYPESQGINWIPYETLIPTEDNATEALLQFYKSIAFDKRDKVFIGPDRLWDAYEMLNCDIFCQIPEINSFSRYDTILESLPNFIDSRRIVVLCCGPMAKPLIADILKFAPEATCLDCGSAFDPIIGKNTRARQMKPQDFRKYFKDLLL